MWLYTITIQSFLRRHFFHIGPFSHKKLKRNKQKLGEIHLSHLHPQQQQKCGLIIFHFTVTGTFY